MNALFVAVKLPPAATSALKIIQPAASQHVRTSPQDNLHLTLRYIGRVPSEPFEKALSKITSAPFRLCLSGTGHFGSRHQGLVLWAGIQPSSELNGLQKKIEGAVIAAGAEPVNNVYKPHITLARCKANTPRAVLEKYANQQITMCFNVEEFGLYASVPAEGAHQRPPFYQQVHSYRLTG